MSSGNQGSVVGIGTGVCQDQNCSRSKAEKRKERSVKWYLTPLDDSSSRSLFLPSVPEPPFYITNPATNFKNTEEETTESEYEVIRKLLRDLQHIRQHWRKRKTYSPQLPSAECLVDATLKNLGVCYDLRWLWLRPWFPIQNLKPLQIVIRTRTSTKLSRNFQISKYLFKVNLMGISKVSKWIPIPPILCLPMHVYFNFGRHHGTVLKYDTLPESWPQTT